MGKNRERWRKKGERSCLFTKPSQKVLKLSNISRLGSAMMTSSGSKTRHLLSSLSLFSKREPLRAIGGVFVCQRQKLNHKKRAAPSLGRPALTAYLLPLAIQGSQEPDPEPAPVDVLEFTQAHSVIPPFWGKLQARAKPPRSTGRSSMRKKPWKPPLENSRSAAW